MKTKKQRQSEALARWQNRVAFLKERLKPLLDLPKDQVSSEVAEEALYLNGRLEVAKREIANLEAKGVR